ncbi:hypothetical protein [Phormidium tenue]|jgi:hypothetical protein|uniref:Uncharacterized protein n=1 Tax=Phormidium tenue FACHB-1050 TaxID=2692857 RepID=A0ABR8CEM0_9CYAN|nr:hypothetical protein [Phormidium tenue]MBD2318136.1 hypothetical protein [Phormidium tenue FACHB-1050]
MLRYSRSDRPLIDTTDLVKLQQLPIKQTKIFLERVAKQYLPKISWFRFERNAL